MSIETKSTHPYVIGQNYYVRTVTYHFTGCLAEVYDNELVLTTAAWVADSGRFSEAMHKGTFNEVEPYPAEAKVIINRSGIIDVSDIHFPLPTEVK